MGSLLSTISEAEQLLNNIINHCCDRCHFNMKCSDCCELEAYRSDDEKE